MTRSLDGTTNLSKNFRKQKKQHKRSPDYEMIIVQSNLPTKKKLSKQINNKKLQRLVKQRLQRNLREVLIKN